MIIEKEDNYKHFAVDYMFCLAASFCTRRDYIYFFFVWIICDGFRSYCCCCWAVPVIVLRWKAFTRNGIAWRTVESLLWTSDNAHCSPNQWNDNCYICQNRVIFSAERASGVTASMAVAVAALPKISVDLVRRKVKPKTIIIIVVLCGFSKIHY